MDPMTLAMAMGSGGGVLTNILKGITGFIAGNNQQKVLENAATQHLSEGGVNAQEELQAGDQKIGQGAVAAAAGGGGFVGSNLSALSQLSSQAMFNARTQAYRARTQAQSDIYQGGVAKANGVNALIGGFMGAASSLAGGFMQQSQLNQQKQSVGSLHGFGDDTAADIGAGY